MAKRLKLRISRLITASLQSCHSKDPSILPLDPVPSFFQLSPRTTVDSKAITKPPSSTASKPHRSSFKSHVSSAFTSVGCGSRSKSNSPGDNRIESQLFHWQQKEEEWQLVNDNLEQSSHRRSNNNNNNGLVTLPPPLTPEKKRIKRRNTKKKTTRDPHRSMKSPTDSTVFSSEEIEREETETLVSSSRSFSTDSSPEFSPHLRTIREKPIKARKKKKKKKKKKRSKGCGSNSIHRLSVSSPARLSVFKKLIPEAVVEGKVKESFAVVKKSEDPYQDFKKSMMDMIWEKEMFEEGELEQLLECFLSLNSPCHHQVIVEAFAEIWNAMFCTGSTSNRNSNDVSIIDDHLRSST